MKKQNAGDVYYFLEAAIKNSNTKEQLLCCERLLSFASQYAFVPELQHQLLWQRVLLIAERYPVVE
jgi:hypothetical protein